MDRRVGQRSTGGRGGRVDKRWYQKNFKFSVVQ